jgi:hypothetical protein
MKQAMLIAMLGLTLAATSGDAGAPVAGVVNLGTSVSVGGFLGLGRRLVAIPVEQIRDEQGRLILPGATKEALKGLPEFQYAG